MKKFETIIHNNIKISICIGLIILLFIVGNIITGGNFASPAATIKFAAFIAIFGLGQMLIICSGGYIDLSIGYCATLVSCLTAGVMDGKDENFVKALLISIAIGIVVGMINGLLSVYVKLPSLVVTLAMSEILQGIVDVYCSSWQISGKASPIVKQLAAKNTGVFPNIMLFLIILAGIVMFLLYRTKIGNQLEACGSNEITAYLSGIKVKKVRVIAFVVCDVIACMTGLLLLGNLGIAFKDMASSYVMPSIAAVVIGGLSINGGQKNYIGVILGAIVLQALTNLFVSLGFGDSGKWLGYGIILLLMLIAYIREKTAR